MKLYNITEKKNAGIAGSEQKGAGKIMVVKNVKIYTAKQVFMPGTVITEGSKIQNILLDENNNYESGGISSPKKAVEGRKYSAGEEEIEMDGQGAYCIPGMIDLHFHGCMGYDVCDGTKEAVHEIAAYELTQGVTSIAPATMTLPVKELHHILKIISDCRKEQEEQGEYLKEASLAGINMEGPFISPVKKGAQDAKYILPCSKELCMEFQKQADGLVKFIGLAPEEGKKEEVEQFIREVKDIVSVSLAHTNAGYDRAAGAFYAGANHLVHMYNAMPPFQHREPGVIGAAADYRHVMAEIICDGVHVHPSAVRGAFRLMGKDRIIFISDSMRAAGMKDGRYTLGGQEVDVRGNRATMVSDGALAGSVTMLPDCVRIAVKEMKIPLEAAIACATVNPARSLGIDKEYGSLEEGKKADFILWDENLQLKKVVKSGKIVL